MVRHSKFSPTSAATISFLTALILNGCGTNGAGIGTGSSGSAISFSMPSTVSVIQSKTNSSSSVDDNSSFASYLDSSSDYMTVRQDFDRVNHPVGESLSTVKEIICFVGLLGADKMWVEAKLPRVYLVGVDDSTCSSSSGQPSQGAASGGSGSSAKKLKMVTVRLSREAADAYPRMEIWFTEPSGPGDQPMEIRANVDVLQEPNAITAPYGRFNLNFTMRNNSGVSIGGGSLNMNSSPTPISYTFYESMSASGWSQTRGASVEQKADGSSLKAAVQSVSSGGSGSSDAAWVVATNSTSVKANNKNSSNSNATTVSQVNLNGGVCLSLQNFKYRIFGYGLFRESDGGAVTLNSGVGCKYTDSSGNQKNCYIGKQGAWFERETSGSEHTLADGDTVTRQEWGSGSSNNGQSLTISVKAGKLNKYTVRKYTLTEINGVEMRYYDSGGSSEYIVAYSSAGYSGAGAGFYKLATMSWGNSGPSKTDITPAKITINANQFIFFYSEMYGGVNFVGGNTYVTAREEVTILPSSSDISSGGLALKCTSRCPKGGITQPNLTSWSGPYESDPDPTNKASAIDYYFEKNSMKLFKGTASTDPEVKLNTGVTFSGTGSVYKWGIESGAMITTAAYTAATNLFDIFNTEGSTYYQYRMGPNSWDKLVMVHDGTNYLSFDDPMVINYTHTTANDRNGDSTFNGKKFLLRYRGYGQLEGLPWDQVDRDGDGTPDMWFPRVALKDGIQMTSSSTNYRIKAMFGEKTLTTTGADCSDISTLSLPTTSVPTSASGSASNASTAKPSYGTCMYSSDTKSAVGCN